VQLHLVAARDQPVLGVGQERAPACVRVQAHGAVVARVLEQDREPAVQRSRALEVHRDRRVVQHRAHRAVAAAHRLPRVVERHRRRVAPRDADRDGEQPDRRGGQRDRDPRGRRHLGFVCPDDLLVRRGERGRDDRERPDSVRTASGPQRREEPAERVPGHVRRLVAEPFGDGVEILEVRGALVPELRLVGGAEPREVRRDDPETPVEASREAFEVAPRAAETVDEQDRFAPPRLPHAHPAPRAFEPPPPQPRHGRAAARRRSTT